MTGPGIFARKPALRGTKLLLRPFTPDDIDDIGAVLADPEVLRLTGSVSRTAETLGRSADLDEATRQWYNSRADQADRLDLAIVDLASGRCVGEAVLNELRERDDACNFRILIGPAGRNRGLGTEATRLMVDHAFRSTTLHRIELEVYAFNPRARRAYERVGFRYEGEKRQAFRFDDEYIDTIVMGMLRTDWEQLDPV